MIEIAIQDIQKYDLNNLYQEVLLNINGQKYSLIPTINGTQYILTLVSDGVQQAPKQPRKAGSAKGKIWMSDDFDEPLELDELFAKVKGKLPKDYRFDRDELYER